MKYKCLLFGVGVVALDNYDHINDKYDIVGFIDNALSKQHTYFNGTDKYIYAPSEIKDLSFDRVILLSVNYASEMYSQLLNIGVREHEIIVDYVCRKNNVYIYDFYKMQINEYRKFNRFDIVVKYMAIRAFYSNDVNVIEIYKEMQRKRLNLNNDEVENDWTKFCELVESIKKGGYDKNSYIVCDEKMHVMDGAHRVAACIYFGIENIPVKIVPQKFDCDYTIDWFWKNCFDVETILKIENNQSIIINNNSSEIVGVIWNTAFKFKNEILYELGKLEKIIEIEEMSFNREEYKSFVRNCYSVDDIEEWKIEKKIESMLAIDSYKVLIIHLKIEEPEYRLKIKNGLPISRRVENIKKIIRNRFKCIIDNYYYDNILHLSDNYYQSKLLTKIIKLPIDFYECFNEIEKYRYALIKYDVPYMPSDYPKSIPVHKDADLICKMEDYSMISDTIYNYLKNYSVNNELEINVINLRERIKIRCMYMDFLIYQFDISYQYYDFERRFIEEALDNRVKIRNFYSLSDQYEIIVRENEYKLYPHKKYHLEYVERKREGANESSKSI